VITLFNVIGQKIPLSRRGRRKGKWEWSFIFQP